MGVESALLMGYVIPYHLEEGTPGRFGDGVQDGDQYTSTNEGKDDAANKAEIAKAQQAGQEATNAGANDTCNDVAYKFITAATQSDVCQETGDQANEKPGQKDNGIKRGPRYQEHKLITKHILYTHFTYKTIGNSCIASLYTNRDY